MRAAAFFQSIWAGVKSFSSAGFVLLALSVLLLALYGRQISRIGTRGMALVAVFCALAAAGGAALVSLPGIQPTSFLVIMSGVLLGPAAGLCAGSVSALLFDLLSVVGIYTPWRVFFWGLMGLLAGYLPKKVYFTAPYGFVWGFVFGWVMNIVWYSTGAIPWRLSLYAAACAASFPFDLSHAVCNAALLAAFTVPLQKMARRAGIIKKRQGETK